MILRWIVNPDLHLPRFVKPRVDKILLVAPADAWNYVSSGDNPAGIGTREHCIKKFNCSSRWLHGFDFLMQEKLKSHQSVVVRRLCVTDDLSSEECTGLDNLINAAPSLYVLKKRLACLSLFKQWYIRHKMLTFCKPTIDTNILDCPLIDAVRYV